MRNDNDIFKPPNIVLYLNIPVCSIILLSMSSKILMFSSFLLTLGTVFNNFSTTIIPLYSYKETQADIRGEFISVKSFVRDDWYLSYSARVLVFVTIMCTISASVLSSRGSCFIISKLRLNIFYFQHDGIVCD